MTQQVLDEITDRVSSDVGDVASRRVVAIVVEAAADVSGRFKEAASRNKSHDLLFAALAPELVLGSILSRSATSLMGSQFYPRLATGLAHLRYGTSAVPRTLVSPSVHDAGISTALGEDPSGHDVHILSAYDELAVTAEVEHLQQRLKAEKQLKIGTPNFDEAFMASLERVRDKPLERTAWRSQNDFAVVPGIGLVEMESGGDLDSSNVQSQVKKLIRGGLALGRPDVKLYWSLAYANRGEGAPPKTPLRNYLTYSVKEPGRLLAGSQWWEMLLPQEMSYGDLVETVGAVGDHFTLASISDVMSDD